MGMILFLAFSKKSSAPAVLSRKGTSVFHLEPIRAICHGAWILMSAEDHQLIEVSALRFGNPQSKPLISLLVLSSMLLPAYTALADDGFGGDWQAKPLVDNSAPAVVTPQPQVTSSPTAPVVQPDLEAKLKPVEPFILEVENRLTLKTKPGVTIVQRLNTLQTVLFGAQKYQDAGELIAKLAEIFPQEAQKAQAELEKQFQSAMQASAAPSNLKVMNPKSPMMPTGPGTGPAYRPAQPGIPSRMAQAAPQKKRGFWNNDDFSSDFDNDPFFQDLFQGRVKTSTTRQGMSSMQNGFPQSNAAQGYGSPAYSQQPYGAQAYGQQPNGPSHLAAMAQGLVGLALAAGGMAGAYYLNNKMPSGNRAYGNNYRPYPNGGYGYGPNGISPYGVAPYGVNPYGAAPGTTYNYGGITYGNVNPYGSGALINPYAVAPYVSPSYNSAIPFGNGQQTYSFSPYGIGNPGYQSYSGSGF
jgi:hypothetical protein